MGTLEPAKPQNCPHPNEGECKIYQAVHAQMPMMIFADPESGDMVVEDKPLGLEDCRKMVGYAEPCHLREFWCDRCSRAVWLTNDSKCVVEDADEKD